MKFKIETNLYDDGKPMFCKRQIEIEPGLTILVGCNGSGKTTLLDQIRTIVRDKEIPYIKYNNLTDGNETSYSMSMAAYFVLEGLQKRLVERSKSVKKIIKHSYSFSWMALTAV